MVVRAHFLEIVYMLDFYQMCKMSNIADFQKGQIVGGD